MIAEVFFLKQEASWISFFLHHTFPSISFLALLNTVKNSVCNGQGKFVWIENFWLCEKTVKILVSFYMWFFCSNIFHTWWRSRGQGTISPCSKHDSCQEHQVGRGWLKFLVSSNYSRLVFSRRFYLPMIRRLCWQVSLSLSPGLKVMNVFKSILCVHMIFLPFAWSPVHPALKEQSCNIKPGKFCSSWWIVSVYL